MIDAVSKLLSGGRMPRVALRNALGVHRNTWTRHEAQLISEGVLRRVGRFDLELVEARQAEAPRAATLTGVDMAAISNSDTQVLSMVLEEARAFVSTIEALLHQIAPADAPDCTTIAPADAPDCTTIAPDCTTIAPADAPDCTTIAPKTSSPSCARAVFLALPKHPALRQAGQAHEVVRETPPENLTNSDDAKRKRFQTLWRTSWKNRFPSRTGAPPIAALRNPDVFARLGFDELEDSEFAERLERFFADEKAADNRYPVSWFVAGIHTDYADDSEDFQRALDTDAAPHRDAEAAEHIGAQKEPEKSVEFDGETVAESIQRALNEARIREREARERAELERVEEAREQARKDAEARKSSPWRNGRRSLLDAIA